MIFKEASNTHCPLCVNPIIYFNYLLLTSGTTCVELCELQIQPGINISMFGHTKKAWFWCNCKCLNISKSNIVNLKKDDISYKNRKAKKKKYNSQHKFFFLVFVQILNWWLIKLAHICRNIPKESVIWMFSSQSLI